MRLQKRLTSFIKDPSYPGGVTPQDEATQKRLKHLIDTHLLMDTRTREEKKIIFGKFWKLFPFLLSTFLIMTYLFL